MRTSPLLSRLTLALLLATTARAGIDAAHGATATATKTPAVAAAPKAPPADAPAEEPPSDEEPEVIDEGAEATEASEGSATADGAPVETETTTDADPAAEPEGDPATETTAENDGEPADTEATATEPPLVDDHGPAGAATDRPPVPATAKSAGPAGPSEPPPAAPPTAPKDRPSLLHRTPPPPGSPPPPPPKAEALPRPPRSLLGEGSPLAPGGATRAPSPAAAKPATTGEPSRAPATATTDDRGLPSLAALTATRERPLFVPGRRGPEQKAPAVVTMEPAAPSEEVEPPEAPFTAVLGGVVAGPGLELAILIDPSTNAVSRVKRGEDHDGWTLAELDRRTATFRRGDERAVLKLKPPGSTVVSGTTGSDEEGQPVVRKPGPRPHGAPPGEEEPHEE